MPKGFLKNFIPAKHVKKEALSFAKKLRTGPSSCTKRCSSQYFKSG
jgi:hypothetical protein